AVVAAAALCAVAALPEHAGAAGTPGPYAFAEGTETVEGATSNVEGHRLSPGRSYKSALPRAGQRFYRLELDARESAYVSVTAIPKRGTQVSYADGVEVSVQDADGSNCTPLEAEEARFGSSESPRPITATASRRVGPDEKSCAEAGTYYVVVERTRTSRSARESQNSQDPQDPQESQDSQGYGSSEASPEDWDLEIHVASEPGLKAGDEAEGEKEPPQSWDSSTPVPPTGERRPREGGTSFSSARGLEGGVWGAEIESGQTLFYRVPVDWGQRLSATAELGSSSVDGFGGSAEWGGAGRRGTARGSGYVSSALVMSLYNPVRAQVDDAHTAYDGRQKSAALEPLPPIAYENRFAPADEVATMRFAGWYYLAVHLSSGVAEKFGDGPLELTLRVDVGGDPEPGPAYAGSPRPADEFRVTERDAAAARRGDTAAAGGGAGSGRDEVMAVVAAGGIGTGVVLLGILGVWTLVARRRAAAAVAAEAVAAEAAVAGATGVAPGAVAEHTERFGPPRRW
ncbi:hypothetical protein IPZ68_30175, partial [Streptomyces arenae]|nr:hypothetical protein [Streptomyces arenae]